MKMTNSNPFGTPTGRKAVLSCLIGAAFSILQTGWAQTSVTNSTAGNTNWLCPSNVYTVQVQATGGGGGGGGCYANYSVAGGGAGGSYVRYSVNVTPGTTYNLTVGAGGTGGAITNLPGGTGGSSYFGNTTPGSSAGSIVLATGGAGGSAATVTGTTNGVTGGVAGGIGSITGNLPVSGAAANTPGISGGTSIAGPEGGTNSPATSGAGGQGAPSSGGSYVGGAGGAAKVSTTAGSLAGAAGTAPGGGGSGGWRVSSTTVPVGGAGGAGRVVLTYVVNTNIAGSSTVVASPTSVPADNTTVSTVTVTLIDASANPITNKTVTLTSSRGATDTISPASVATSTTGVATFTVKSAAGGSGVFTATDTTDSITVSQTAVVTFLSGSVTVDHFTVTPSAGSVTAGQVFTATVQAYSTSGIITNNAVDGIAATMTSSGSAQFDANGDGVYGDALKSLTNGAFTINVRDLKAEAITLTASVSTNTGTSSAVTVTPAAVAQLQLLLPGESAAPGTVTGKTGTPATQTAGTGFSVIVNSVDANWNVASSSDTVQLSSSNFPSAILPASTPLVAGTVTLTVTNVVSGGSHTLTATDVTSGGVVSSTSGTYLVVPGAAAHLLVLAPGETAAFGSAPGKTGSAINETPTVGYSITVDALDAYYNLATNDTDTAGILSSDTTATLPSNLALVGGTKTFSLTNNAVGTFAITATNISNSAVASGSSTVTTTNIVTITTLASSVNPANAGSPIIFTATIGGAGKHTGTVTYKSGSTTLGTATVSSNAASFTTTGGVGTNLITAIYSGDSNSLASTSSPVTQVIQAGVVANPAQMQDGFDYNLIASMPTTNLIPGVSNWICTSDISSNTANTGNILIQSGDINSQTTPLLSPLPNVTTNVAAHLYINKGATDREFLRSIGAPITSGSAYFSFVIQTAVNPTNSVGEPMATMLAASSNNAPYGNDPVTLYSRKGTDTTHYNLGIQRLGGPISWGAANLADGSNYIIVLQYTFGGNNQLFINPTPGDAPPTPDAVATTGTNSEPSNIGTILFYESGSPPTYPLPSDGRYYYDVMRVDTNWYSVTPSANSSSPGAASLAISTASQYFKVNTNSGLITVSLLDQSGSNFVATASTVVSLSSSSTGGVFLDPTTLAVITSVTIPAGSNSASFYYQDSVQGAPTITVSGGLLAPATQTETVLPAVTTIDHFVVTSSVPGTSAGSVFQVTAQAIDAANHPITDNITDGTIVTFSSTGQVQFDANHDGVYGDTSGALTNGTITFNALDNVAETVNLTVTYGPISNAETNFVVTAGTFARLQLLMPGETAAPGTISGKTGSPSVETAGVAFTVTVYSTDANWNKVGVTDTVSLAVSGDAQALLPTNTALASGTATLPLTDYIAGSALAVTASDVSSTNIAPATGSTYAVSPGAEAQLVLLLPGETATPGFSPGKTGTPSAQYASIGYNASVLGVDAYWNLVTTATNTVTLTSSATGDGLPAAAQLVSGTRTLSVTNFTVGSTTLTAVNLATNLSLTGGSSTVAVGLIPTTTAVSSSPNPSVAGQPIHFTATVSGLGKHTGTVTFKAGSSPIGTGTLSGNTASFITYGVVGSYSITAVYGGDVYNAASASAPLTQVVTTNGYTVLVRPAQMQDGMDYALATTTPTNGRAPWGLYQDGGLPSVSTSFIGIYTNDLSGATVPDVQPLPNASTNVEAHLQVASPASSYKIYERSIGAPVSSGQVYVSFLMGVTVNPTGTNETRCTLLASNAYNNASASDPLSLHIRAGADATHYNLGVERLNGAVAWATNSLADLTNYLVVLKYAFGPSSSNSLYINPVPGAAEPAPDAAALSDGITAEPANIGNIGLWESYSLAPITSGTLVFDVMRADTNWYSATPSALEGSLGPISVAFTSTAQTNVAHTSSQAITVAMLDENGNPVTATSDTVVYLASSSAAGVFLDASSNVITSVTVSNGTSAATFYYEDGIGGYPVLTASSGLLAPGTQSETVFMEFFGFADSYPGFFSGVNIWFTNVSGLSLHTWSSTNLGLSVSNWVAEGAMQEQSLAPALPGMSRYSINVNPVASPTYYIAGAGTSGPYVSSQPLSIITTVDFVDDFVLTVTNAGITQAGVFQLGGLPTAPSIIGSGLSLGAGGFQLQFSGSTNSSYTVQASTDLLTWSNISSGTILSSPVSFTDPAATNYPTRFYRIFVH